MSNTENEIDYGPLQPLIGRWEGTKGTDLSPEPDGEESTPYYETLVFTEAGTVANAGQQTLAVLRYHQVVKRLSDNEVFHDETGYWMWDAAKQTIMHSLLVPRAVGVLAGGTYKASNSTNTDSVELKVAAKIDDPDWSIIQSPFMRDNAKTIAFSHQINVSANHLSYKETTVLDIYGKVFDHTDENTLNRCGDDH
ncbi:MAG: FABP family protein [Gammaproteobacteria bacterium]|nr:FABP family protein [Gammaproteobacteria bacterium]MBQ0840337.1 FABP family protein [Gammaproteobacteria bacterium]